MNEPDWCNMGYHENGYGAECNTCETVVELSFGEGERPLLTPKHKDDDFSQTELFAFVFYWTLQKLEQECDCNRKV